ncbi:MAG: hypothetical protein EOO24_48570, partial [Comamonadaceae bacterium]
MIGLPLLRIDDDQVDQHAGNLDVLRGQRAAGGVVIAQVKRLAQRGTLPAKNVKIPGMLVDLVVVDPEQRQTYH